MMCRYLSASVLAAQTTYQPPYQWFCPYRIFISYSILKLEDTGMILPTPTSSLRQKKKKAFHSRTWWQGKLLSEPPYRCPPLTASVVSFGSALPPPKKGRKRKASCWLLTFGISVSVYLYLIIYIHGIYKIIILIITTDRVWNQIYSLLRDHGPSRLTFVF